MRALSFHAATTALVTAYDDALADLVRENQALVQRAEAAEAAAASAKTRADAAAAELEQTKAATAAQKETS